MYLKWNWSSTSVVGKHGHFNSLHEEDREPDAPDCHVLKDQLVQERVVPQLGGEGGDEERVQFRFSLSKEWKFYRHQS